MHDDQHWDSERAAAIIQSHVDRPGAVLPILHALQAEFGYIADAAIPAMALALNLSRAEIHGVVTFYHDLRREPPGRHRLQLCRAEACQSTGAEGIAAGVLERLSVSWGGTTADGAITVDAVYCLGLCACAPAALLDGAPIGRMSPKTIEAALDEVLR